MKAAHNMDQKKVTNLKLQNFLKKKQLGTWYQRQLPEQLSSSRAEKGQQRMRTSKKEKKKKQAKQKNEELCPKKQVSKPLMDALWAKFKLRRSPTVQDCYSLSFQFSMTDKQVQQWFHEKRKKYKEEMSKQKEKKQD